VRVLVTGANGFVGQALCRRLVAAGYDVDGVVRRPSALADGVVERRIAGLGPETPWDDLLDGVDAVVHLAARVHVMKDRAADPAAAFRRVNTEATLALAAAAIRRSVGQFVTISSIKVNGEVTRPGHPFTALDPPAPDDPYGQSKWAAEQGLARLVADGPMGVTIFRPPLLYGPGVKGNFLRLMRAVAAGWPLPLGAIDNRRSLLGVANLADAIARVLAGPATGCRTYLLRDGEDVSTPELIRRMAGALGRPARLFALPVGAMRGIGAVTGRRGAVDRLTGSLTVDDQTFRSRYEWTAPETLDQGLAVTAAWFTGRR
jgi:nucleoside-diphosphate-sugar epimerase